MGRCPPGLTAPVLRVHSGDGQSNIKRVWSGERWARCYAGAGVLELQESSYGSYSLTLFLRTEHPLRKPVLGPRGTLPFGSKSRQRTGTKKQISHAEWRKVEHMKRKKNFVAGQDVTKNPIHRVSSPDLEKPGKVGYIFKGTFHRFSH